MGRAVQWAEPEWVPSKSKSKSLTQRSTGDFTEVHGGDLVQILAASDPSEFDSEIESRIDAAPWVVVDGSVNLLWLLGEPIAVQRRVIKAMGEYVRLPLEFKHVEEILHFAAEGEAGKELSLPLGWKIVRSQETLELVTPDLRRQGLAQSEDDYEYELPVPGCVVVKETRSSFITTKISSDASTADDEVLLDAASLTETLTVRNWRAGDRFWPAHTKSPKKIKELLQGRAAGQAERKLWPVIVSGDVIVWVRGFPATAKFQAKPGKEAVLIEETKLADGGGDVRSDIQK
jgi:tRNA(Ile)-lysidine synthetase-like protein